MVSTHWSRLYLIDSREMAVVIWDVFRLECYGLNLVCWESDGDNHVDGSVQENRKN